MAQFPNAHAQGQYSLEGWARDWMQNRRDGLARQHNLEEEQQRYFEAMDNLYVLAAEVNRNKCVWPYKNSRKNKDNFSVGMFINHGREFGQTAELKDHYPGWNG